ncbi:hypothetical protein [Rhodoblastus sp.]|uniref:hypothetical protein n=1 Tax=Rhodoblastus sp. TaxID=1962975 RepID=UPI003F9B6A4B
MTYQAIIEDSANTLWMVRGHDIPELAHCFFGVQAKRAKGGGFIRKTGSKGEREVLVRRECTNVVAYI